MFTQRHYEAIAGVLQQHFTEIDERQWDALPNYGPTPTVERALAAMFKADNPRFDPSRFYRACAPVE